MPERAIGRLRLPARVERRAAARRWRRHLALACIAIGLAASPLEPTWWALVSLATGAVVALAAGPRGLAATLAALVLAGALVGDLRLAAIEGPAPSPGPIAARAWLLESPRTSAFGASAPIELRDGPWAGARLLARADSELELPDLAPGSEVAVDGDVRIPRPSDPGEFDLRGHLRRQGIAAELDLRTIAATGGRRGGPAGAIDAMRARAGAAIDAGLQPREAALLRGMVLGEGARIPALARDDFRRSGLAHLLAVSGQNVMLLGLLALPLLVWARARPRVRIGVLLALIALYVPLAGAGPSLQRAGIMGAAALVAVAAGRPASRWYALLLAAVGTLAIDPLASGDPGWQLSFAAVTGILLLGRPLTGRLRMLPRPLGDAIAITAAATLATAPLLAVHFGRVSLVSLPANLLALPAVAPAMWLGMLDIGVAQLELLGEPFAASARAAAIAIGWLAAVPVAYLASLARAAAQLPWSEVEVGAAAVAAGCAALAAVSWLAIARTRAGRWQGQELASRWRVASGRERRAVAALMLALIASLGALVCAPPQPPVALTVRFLDVGQGDATLIQGRGGEAILFDGGRPEARVANLLRSAGVRRLDAIVATHQSADHHGGLHEVVQRFPVGLLLENGDGTDDRSFLELLAEARRRGVRVEAARAGQVLTAGELRVRVLAPGPRRPGPAPEDPNPRAVVAIVGSGAFELFLSADAESPSLLPLALDDVDAIKVAHHGSADPGLADVLARLRPELAAIEVGENDYGHPHPTTLAALRAAGSSIYRTDRDGTISLTVSAGEMSIETER